MHVSEIRREAGVISEFTVFGGELLFLLGCRGKLLLRVLPRVRIEAGRTQHIYGDTVFRDCDAGAVGGSVPEDVLDSLYPLGDVRQEHLGNPTNS